LLNVHGLYEVRQMDIHVAEPLEPGFVELEIVGKLKIY
jgi:hypothetical protein